MPNEITLTIETSMFNDHELDHLTRQLQTEILTLDVDRVDRVNGAASPDGTRSGPAVTPNELAIALIPEQVTSLIFKAQYWLKRQQQSVEAMLLKISVGTKIFPIRITDSEPKLKFFASLMEKAMEVPTAIGTPTGTLMEKLRQIKIEGPTDFATNIDLYLAGEKHANSNIH